MSTPPNSAWFPSEQELSSPSGIRRSIQVALERIYALQKTSGTQATTQTILANTIAAGLNPTAIAASLSATGAAPLDLTSLVGKVAEAQLASVPSYTSLPSPSDPVNQPGALISLNGQLYGYSTSTQPGGFLPLASLGAKLEDTHANRLANDPASSYPIAILFYETDRTVFYENDGTYGASNWVYKLGTMTGTLATDQRPTDLGMTDTGFLFFGTDWTITYRWSGSAWIYYSGVYIAATASRPSTLGSNDADFLFIDSTLKVWEYWTGSAWVTLGTVPTTLTLSARIVTGSTATLLATDFDLISLNSGAATFSLLNATTVPDQVFAIKNDSGSTASLLVNAFSAQTIDGNSAYSFAPGEGFMIQSTGGTNWEVISIVRNSLSGICLQGPSTSQLTLTTSFQDIPGCTLTLSRAGLWLIQGIMDFESVVTAYGNFQLVANGIVQTPTSGAIGATSSASPSEIGVQTWLYTASASGLVAKLQAKSGTAGPTVANSAGWSNITATWIHP